MERNRCCNLYEEYPRTDNAFAQTGLLVHELLEGYTNGLLCDFELPGLFEAHFYDYVNTKFPYHAYADLEESYYSSSLAYLAQFEGFGHCKILGSEIEFTIPFVDGHFLHGFIDLLLEDDDGNIVIVDHKSKAQFKNKEEQRHYARQLYLYSLYVYQEYGKYPAELVFNRFRKQAETRIKFTDSDLDEAIGWAKICLKAIMECTDWTATPDPYFCSALCDFKACCKEKDRK